MHLKRVEMENFKSFGQRLDVPFLPGFTAITGPNGSGKSNIGDAIMFVLGPSSSKAMRAGNLKDLIYNGGKHGKPAKECKVTLVFDNEDRTMPLDADEVRLTRRVKLSPSDPDNYYSYFYVNGRPSKQMEFENLLSHARISADGYNIVQQGDVGAIVEMSPVDRRRLLDDIAGITKFDDDIAKADREREEVEANLERLNILLDEIERRMEALGEEKDKAIRYKELKEELSTARLRLALLRRDDLEAQMDSVEETIRGLEEDKAEAEGKLRSLKDDLAEAEARFADLEAEIADLGGDELEEVKQEREAKQLEVWKAEERANEAREDAKEARQARAEAEQAVDELAGRIEETEADVAEMEDDLEAKRAELKDKESGLVEVKETLSDSSSESGRLQRELSEMKQEYEALQDDLHEARLERDRLAELLERADRDIAEMEEELETHRFEVRDLGSEIDELRTRSAGGEVQELEDRLKGKRTEEAELTRALNELEPKIRKLSQRYSQLKAEQEAREKVEQGFTRAVERVLEARDKGELKGIHGAIAELASTDDEHETAVATAAGGRLQCVVVESDEHAQAAIEYLKTNDLGRATFLPLNKMSASRPRGKAIMVERSDEAVGFALDLVDYDEEHKAVMWYVFGDTVVMRDLAGAREHMGGARLVTLDGELVEASGAMTGGSKRRGGLTLGGGTPAELEEVAAELREATERQDALSEQLQEVRTEIGALEDEVRAARQEAEGLEDRIADLELKKRQYEAKVEPLEEGLDKRRTEREEAAETLEGLEADIEDKQARLEELDGAREDKSRELMETADEALTNRMDTLRDEIDALRDEVRDLEGRIETEQARVELETQRLDELKERRDRLEAAIGEHEEAAEEHDARADELRVELEALVEMEKEREGQFKELSQAKDAAYKEKTDLEADIKEVRHRIDSLEDMVLQKRTRLPDLEQELAEVMVEINQRPDEAEALEPVEADLEDAKDEVKSIQARIEAMGDINMKAIDEYERDRERAEELGDQIERLESQREELLKVVEEITKKKKDGLYEVLGHITENFKRIFADLSGGGEADIALEDPENPFEGGLILKAQPTGKKVTRLPALSGGERALTSMAFIFAIQEYMPSPFYVLDEIDQNLDAVNAEKVATMVGRNAQHAQFIIVSLRKVTLKEADHVYGVTMNQPGLSEVVGNVHLDQVSEEGEFDVDGRDGNGGPPADGGAAAEADGDGHGDAEAAGEEDDDEGQAEEPQAPEAEVPAG